MKTSIIVGICVVLLIVIFGGWYVYTNPTISAELGIHHSATGANGMSGMNGGMGTTTPYGHGMMQGGFAVGSIEVLNGTDFTMTLSNGDTKDIDVTATTTIQNYTATSSTPTTITEDQLSVGEQVQVVGTPNSDGSINARFVRTGNVPTPMRGAGRGGQPPVPSQ